MDNLLPFSKEEFPNIEIVTLDFETTGLNASVHEIIEIGAVKTRGKEVVGTFEQLLRPTAPLDPKIEEITGLNGQHLLMFGKDADTVMLAFVDFIGDAVLAGHNIRQFDYPFLARHVVQAGLPAPSNNIVDTLELSRASLNIGNHKLSTLAQYFNIENRRAHRAMADVEATMEVLWKLLELRGIA